MISVVYAVGLTLAADAPATDSASQGPIVVVVLAVVTLLGTGVTAAGPVLLEMVKNRGKPSGAPPKIEAKPDGNAPSAPVASQMVETANNGLSMVEAGLPGATRCSTAPIRAGVG